GARRLNPRHDRFRPPLDQAAAGARDQPAEAADRGADNGATDRHGAERRHPGAGNEHLAAAAPAELVAVAPRRELGTQRLADPDQDRAVAELRHSDVFRGDPATRDAVDLFRLLDRLPALLERGEVPSLAVGADHPEAALGRIEREPPAYRKR